MRLIKKTLLQTVKITLKKQQNGYIFINNHTTNSDKFDCMTV